MQSDLYLENEERNKNVGLLIALVLHALLTLICLRNVFTYYDPPLPDQNSIVITFDSEETSLEESVQESPDVENKDKNEPEPQKAANPNKSRTIESPKPQNQQDKAVVEEAVVKGGIVEDDKEKSQPISQAKSGPSKAEKEKAQLESQKSKFGSLFAKGTSASNNEEKGKDTSTALDNLVSGKGSVGKELGQRKVIYEPVIKESSQKTGKVAVRICVNQQGVVTSAKFTQKGSTTTDTHLVSIATKAAKKYKFSSSENPEECGNVIIEFTVK